MRVTALSSATPRYKGYMPSNQGRDECTYFRLLGDGRSDLLLSPSPSKNLAKKSRVGSLATRRSLKHSKKMVSISKKLDPLSSQNLSMLATRVISLSSVISLRLSNNRLRPLWAALSPSFLRLLELQGLKTSLRFSRRTKRKRSLSPSPRDLLSLSVQ